MKMMDYLGFNPDDVERFSEHCEKALEDAGFTDEEIDDFMNEPVYDNIRDVISNGFQMPKGMLPVDLILNAMGQYTVEALQERFPEEEISYDLDARSRCCLVINGEEYDHKCDNIKSMFKYCYADEPLAMVSEGDIDILNTVVEYGGVKITISLDFDTRLNAFNRSGINKQIVGGIGTTYGELYRSADEVTMKVGAIVPLEGKVTANYNAEVPLTRGEKERLMELTQAVYEKEIVNAKNLYREPVHKNNQSMDLGG